MNIFKKLFGNKFSKTNSSSIKSTNKADLKMNSNSVNPIEITIDTSKVLKIENDLLVLEDSDELVHINNVLMQIKNFFEFDEIVAFKLDWVTGTDIYWHSDEIDLKVIAVTDKKEYPLRIPFISDLKGTKSIDSKTIAKLKEIFNRYLIENDQAFFLEFRDDNELFVQTNIGRVKREIASIYNVVSFKTIEIKEHIDKLISSGIFEWLTENQIQEYSNLALEYSYNRVFDCIWAFKGSTCSFVLEEESSYERLLTRLMDLTKGKFVLKNFETNSNDDGTELIKFDINDVSFNFLVKDNEEIIGKKLSDLLSSISNKLQLEFYDLTLEDMPWDQYTFAIAPRGFATDHFEIMIDAIDVLEN